MWQLTFRTIALVCFIFLTRPIFALPSNDDVTDWTSKVLTYTFTLSYQDLIQQDSQTDQYEQFFSGQAISGLTTFFGEILPIIVKNKLSTNPQPLGPAKITDQGTMNGLHYWRVDQSLRFRSLKKDVWLSVIVIENQDPPLLIQSLSMKIIDIKT